MSGGIGQRSAGGGEGDAPHPSAAGEDRSERNVLLIGEGDLTEETAQALEAGGARVSRLGQPSEGDVREAVKGGGVDSVAVVAGEDPIVLRMALMVRAVSDDGRRRHPRGADPATAAAPAGGPPARAVHAV